MPSIKKLHTHEDGKSCFLIHPKLRDAGTYWLNGEPVVAAYYPYTGHWYVYDDTGRELASIHRDLFQRTIAPLQTSLFVEDPGCMKVPADA